jgi:hypothetical protein
VAKLTATRTTAAAQAWLAVARPARVLNAFDQACNLVNDQGQVLALVSAARGLTPFGLVVAADRTAPFADVRANDPIAWTPEALRLGALTIDYAAATLWDARPNWPVVRATLTARPERFELLAALASSAAPAGSLLELFEPAGTLTLAPALRERALAGATALMTGLAAGEMALAEAGVTQLAGLGGGLTPAGDDFVLGVCLAAHAGAFGPAAVAQLPALAAALASRTATLSAAYVRAAARGECASYWHAVLAALAGPLPALAEAVGALVSIGHTSGADGLAGFLAQATRVERF